MKAKYSHALYVAVGMILALIALEFYPVRELAAALAIFSVLFVTFGSVILVVLMTEHVAISGMLKVHGWLAGIHRRHAMSPSHPARELAIKN